MLFIFVFKQIFVWLGVYFRMFKGLVWFLIFCSILVVFNFVCLMFEYLNIGVFFFSGSCIVGFFCGFGKVDVKQLWYLLIGKGLFLVYVFWRIYFKFGVVVFMFLVLLFVQFMVVFVLLLMVGLFMFWFLNYFCYIIVYVFMGNVLIVNVVFFFLFILVGIFMQLRMLFL